MNLPVSIPDVNAITDQATREVCRALRQCIHAIYGGAKTEHAALLQGAARDIGMIGFDGDKMFYKAARSRPTGDSTIRSTAIAPGSTLVLSGEFDASGGLATGSYDIANLGLPTGAIVTRAWYYVKEAFAGSGSQIGFGHADDTNGILAQTALGSFGVGAHQAIPNGTVANYTNKTTADRSIQAHVSAAALTAGKLILFIEAVTT